MELKSPTNKSENGLPQGWLSTNVGIIADIQSGNGFPKHLQGHTDGEIPFYKVGDISKTLASGSIYLKKSDNYVSRDVCKQLRA